jgi:hypothetical protein
MVGGDTSGESVCAHCGARAGYGRIFCENCGRAKEASAPLVDSVPQMDTTRAPVLADAIGFVLIAGQLAVAVHWLVPDDGTRLVPGILAYGVLVAVAIVMWHGKEAERFSDANDWLGVFFGSILLGAMSFAVDVLIGSSEYPGISPFIAGTKVGSPFGFLLTIFLCPGMTMVAVGSIARCFLDTGKGTPSELAINLDRSAQ